MGQHLMQLGDLLMPQGVLDVDVNVITGIWLEDGLEHREVHLVVPVIMTLPILLMIEARLVGHDQGAEMQIVVIEEIVDAVQVELQLGRPNLGPLDLEIRR